MSRREKRKLPLVEQEELLQLIKTLVSNNEAEIIAEHREEFVADASKDAVRLTVATRSGEVEIWVYPDGEGAQILWGPRRADFEEDDYKTKEAFLDDFAYVLLFLLTGKGKEIPDKFPIRGGCLLFPFAWPGWLPKKEWKEP